MEWKGHPTTPERGPSTAGLGEGAAVRRCVPGPEPPPQPLFLNFKQSEGAAGEGVRAQRASLILGLPEAPRPPPIAPLRGSQHTWGCAGTRLGTWAVLHSCGVTGGSRRLSGDGGDGQRPGQGSRGASRPAQPRGQQLGGGSAPGKVEAGSAGGLRGSESLAAQDLSAPAAILLLSPAPAQSPSRPNPIVPPGLGLASVTARTK